MLLRVADLDIRNGNTTLQNKVGAGLSDEIASLQDVGVLFQ